MSPGESANLLSGVANLLNYSGFLGTFCDARTLRPSLCVVPTSDYGVCLMFENMPEGQVTFTQTAEILGVLMSKVESLIKRSWMIHQRLMQ